MGLVEDGDVEVVGVVDVEEGASDVVVVGLVEDGDVEVGDLKIEEGANCACVDCINIIFEIKEAVNKIAKLIPIAEKNIFIYQSIERII